MSVLGRYSSVAINGVWYKVTKSPAEGFWVEPEKDQWTLLVFIDEKWYIYVPTDFTVEELIEDNYVNVRKIYYQGDLFNINGQRYLISEQLTGFHIDFGEPNYLVVDNSVFMASQEIEVNQVQEERSSNLSGIPEQILLENMDLEQAKIYCHNFPSDNCKQGLVKKIYGPNVINRRLKGKDVNEWVETLLLFDPSSLEDPIEEFYSKMRNPKYRDPNLFMVLIDWYIANKIKEEDKWREIPHLKNDLYQIIDGLMSSSTPEFIKWLVDTKLNPSKFNLKYLLDLYLKGEYKEEIIKTLQYLLDKKIEIELPLLSYIGLPSNKPVDKKLPSLDRKILELLDRFGYFNRYRNLDSLTEDLVGLIKYKKFDEIDFLAQKGYSFRDTFFKEFDDYFNNIRRNFYEWANTRNFKLSDQTKRLLIQNAIKIDNKEEAVELLEFIKSQGLPEDVIVFNIYTGSTPWNPKARIYKPEGIVEEWFRQNGIRWDPTRTINH